MDVVPFVDLKAQYRFIESDVRRAVDRVLESSSFILGPEVAAFEEEFAAYCGAKYCVGLESGTAALKLALLALGVGPGDEVILPANTYIASALAISQTGATPVLVDINEFYHLDMAQLRAAITPRTKAIMPVHLYGQAVPMGPIVELARSHDVRIVEDACQAHGAIVDGKRVGSLGDVGCFSFYPGKNLGAYGDAGALVTNDYRLADEVRLARDFGQRKKYEHLIKGDNCRLDSLQAAILRVKLQHLDSWNERRRMIAEAYDAALTNIGVPPPRSLGNRSHVYHLYVVELPDRDGAQNLLSCNRIETGIHYPVPLHRQPAYAELALPSGSFPRTEQAALRVLSLPMFPELTEIQMRHVVSTLESHMAGLKSLSFSSVSG